MPCNTIRTTSVALENAQPALLEQALASLGFTVVHDGAIMTITQNRVIVGSYDGKSLVLQDRYDLSLVKRTYAAEVVKAASARFGWRLQPRSPTQFVAQRRA